MTTPHSNKQPFRVCILGASLDNGNFGVQALAASLVRIVHTVRPDAALSFFYGRRQPCAPQSLKVGDGAVPVEIVNYRLSPRARPGQNLGMILFLAFLYRLFPFLRKSIRRSNRAIRTLVEAELVGDIRGGDSFTDLYGLGRFITGSLPILAVQLLGRRPVLLPQTIGPFERRSARRLAAFIMRRTQGVLARDEDSERLAANLTEGSGVPVRLSPDVAFLLEARPPASEDIRPPLPAGNPTIVGFNISGLLYNGGYTQDNMFRLKCDYRKAVAGILRGILDETAHEVLLVPHTVLTDTPYLESDYFASRTVIETLPAELARRVHLVSGHYDQNEIKGMIARCRLFIGSRMHACIAALSQGIPTVAIAYSVKFAGVFASVGAEDGVIEARTTDTDEVVRRVLRVVKSDPARDTRGAAGAARDRLLGVFSELLKESPSTS